MSKKLPEKYDAKIVEKKWQKYWQEKQIFAWQESDREDNFVIDTPPPTVSGVLHMGHVFSYTQADFVARFQRMKGKDVFYPMGFDDNGLPTERLVEKIIGKKAAIFEAENGVGSFEKECHKIVNEAEEEFEDLFNQIALSVDWKQKYQTISKETQAISQASFIDLYQKSFVEKKLEPVFWDISDRTALAQADIVDKEIEGEMNYINFEVEEKDGSKKDFIQIMTTRPELLPACVAVMVNPNDEKYKHLCGKNAITPIFGVKVPIIADELVDKEKGTGAVMCCTFGDETDVKWWRKYNLKSPVIICIDGTMSSVSVPPHNKDVVLITPYHELDPKTKSFRSLEVIEKNDFANGYNATKFYKNYHEIFFNKNEEDLYYQKGKKIKEAKESIINALKSALFKQEKIKRSVKCAERSGVPIEILLTNQWFIKILDKKAELKAKANECKWFPDFMRIRIEQWIDGLQWDWCISRQRFFGVKFPVWYLGLRDEKIKQDRGNSWYENGEFNQKKADENPLDKTVLASIDQLPVDPSINLPYGYEYVETDKKGYRIVKDQENVEWILYPETDIMDTWATSSISPQISSRGISEEIFEQIKDSKYFNKNRHQKLFPADLRPQAHEIIRTWAFYTIVKSMLHEDKIPWKNLMISGWCLASDKTKMSKSKGNVVTPTALIEEKGSDIVRYWASTSHLGADTAYSEDVFKIGQKLITKIFNAAKFASMNFVELKQNAEITEASDLWILSKLNLAIKKYIQEFEKFEYAKSREVIEEFFWKDFCDNYLEICKVRSYGIKAEKLAMAELNEKQKQEVINKQQSAIKTLYLCLDAILKLFAPFIPHICEEIYSIIFSEEFAEKKSIHARGNSVKIDDILFNQKFYEIGEEALNVIFEVRKFKSEQNISMKTLVKKIILKNQQNILEIIEDLKNVCNVEEVEFDSSESELIKIIL